MRSLLPGRTTPWVHALPGLAVSVLVAVLGFLTGDLRSVLPWALLVAALDLATVQAAPRPSRPESAVVALLNASPAAASTPWVLLLLGGAAAGAATGTLGWVAGPLVLVPVLRAAWVSGRGAVGAVAAIALVATGGAAFLTDRTELIALAQTLPWAVLALAVALALLAARARDVEPVDLAAIDGVLTAPEPGVAAEASALVRRLHELADSLSTGFDAPAAAEMALQDLNAHTPTTRSAVLVGSGDDPAVPLAMRGADRAPWPDPTHADSVLAPAWDGSEEAILREWVEDGVTRSLLAVPMHDSTGSRLGLIVADRASHTPFTRSDLQAAKRVARDHAPTVDLAMVFASLRELAGLEERQRLAREMHDGIAQEVVALGFGLDAVRRSAMKQGSPLAEELDALRHDLTRVLSDLRVHIADLRITVRPDAGLGAMVGDRLQSFGTSTGVRTRMQLDENGFRLPAHTEVLLYRLFLQGLEDARHTGARAVDVSLRVAPPLAELELAHDGAESALLTEDFTEHPLTHLGGSVEVEHGTLGTVVRARLRTRGRGSADLSMERIPQLS